MTTSSNPIAALRRPAATLAVLALALLAPAPAAFASVGVGSGAAGPSLRVDAKGNAEVSYKQGGVPRTVLVPVTGAVIYGGTLKGPDVSKAATALGWRSRLSVDEAIGWAAAWYRDYHLGSDPRTLCFDQISRHAVGTRG